jgi:hypothetical protein
VNDRIPSASCNYPLDVLITVVHLLVLSIRWNEGKVARGKLLSLRTVGPTDNGTVTACSVYNRVWSMYQIMFVVSNQSL